MYSGFYKIGFILGQGEVAIEVKIGDKLRSSALHGLTYFAKHYQPKRTIIVNTTDKARIIEPNDHPIEVLPFAAFLEKLWNQEII